MTTKQDLTKRVIARHKLALAYSKQTEEYAKSIADLSESFVSDLAKLRKLVYRGQRTYEDQKRFEQDLCYKLAFMEDSLETMVTAIQNEIKFSAQNPRQC